MLAIESEKRGVRVTWSSPGKARVQPTALQRRRHDQLEGRVPRPRAASACSRRRRTHGVRPQRELPETLQAREPETGGRARRVPSGRSALGALIRMQPRPPDAAWLSYQARCTHCLLAAIHPVSTRLHAASAQPDTASATACGERTISCGERTRPPCVRSVKDAREMTGRADVIRLHIATQYTERIAPTTNLMKRTGCGSPRSNSS